MSTTPKVLGTPPEPFEGTAAKAENFLSALQTYYYLNDAIYLDESKRVAAALRTSRSVRPPVNGHVPAKNPP
jgi:hypothetical protein